MIFCAGNINEVLAETSLTPFVVIFFNSTRSKAGTVVMILPIILALYSALISQVATVRTRKSATIIHVRHPLTLALLYTGKSTAVGICKRRRTPILDTPSTSMHTSTSSIRLSLRKLTKHFLRSTIAKFRAAQSGQLYASPPSCRASTSARSLVSTP